MSGPARRPLRVAILADMLEEGWPSMDLTADVLVRELGARHTQDVEVQLVRPPLVPISWWVTGGAFPPTRDRVANRYWLYRRALGRARRTADVFHIVDHSYGHLAHHVDASRTIITCHDVDAFERPHRNGADSSGLPGFLAARTARGLRRAARVVCPSQATAEALLHLGLVGRNRIAVVPNGVDSAGPDTSHDDLADRLLGPSSGTIDLLHVGSTIPRKRMDILLRVVAAVCRARPGVRLVRVGGPFTPDQQRLSGELALEGRILVLPRITREELQAVYRRAAALLVTSEREGFCLPVVEAMAAGTPVVMSALPVLREVAAEAGTYVPLEDREAWRHTVVGLLDERASGSASWERRRARCVARAGAFSWARYADTMLEHYRAVRTVGAVATR
jgi:glycosyltransferase involved in cell wall biosynthesis